MRRLMLFVVLLVAFDSIAVDCQADNNQSQPPYKFRRLDADKVLLRRQIGEGEMLVMHKHSTQLWVDTIVGGRYSGKQQGCYVNCDAQVMGMPTLDGMKLVVYEAFCNHRIEVKSLFGGCGGVRFLVKFDEGGNFVDVAMIIHSDRGVCDEIPMTLFADMHAAFGLYKFKPELVASGLPRSSVVEYFVSFAEVSDFEFYDYRKGEIIETSDGRVVWPQGKSSDFELTDADAVWSIAYYPDSKLNYTEAGLGVASRPSIEELYNIVRQELKDYLPLVKMIFSGRADMTIGIRMNSVGVVDGVHIDFGISGKMFKMLPPEIYVSIFKRVKDLKFEIKPDWQDKPGHNVRYSLMVRDL